MPLGTDAVLLGNLPLEQMDLRTNRCQRREMVGVDGCPAGAQQGGQLRKLGIIMAVGKTPEYVAAFAALEQALNSLGWKSGGNLRIDDRWSAGSEQDALGAEEIQPAAQTRR